MRVETPAARSTDPASSHEAAQAITASGRRHTQREQVAEALAKWPGSTTAELAERMGADRYMVGRRMSECETAGDARRSARRHCRMSGRLVETWLPVPKQKALL